MYKQLAVSNIEPGEFVRHHGINKTSNRLIKSLADMVAAITMISSITKVLLIYTVSL